MDTTFVQACLPENSYLDNPSFTSGTQYWTVFGDAIVSREPEGCNDQDAWSLRIRSVNGQAGIWQRLNVTNLRGTYIMLGAFLKVYMGNATVALVRDSDDAIIWQSAASNSSDWKATFTTDAGILLDTTETHVKLKIIGSPYSEFLVDNAVVSPMPDSLQEMARKINNMMRTADMINWLKVSSTTPVSHDIIINPGYYYLGSSTTPHEYEGSSVSLLAYYPAPGKQRWVYLGLGNTESLIVKPGEEKPVQPAKPIIPNGVCPLAYVLLDTADNGVPSFITEIEDIRPFFQLALRVAGIDGGDPCTVYDDTMPGIDGGWPDSDFVLYPDTDPCNPLLVPLATEIFAGIVKFASYLAIQNGIGEGTVRAKHLKPYVNDRLDEYTETVLESRVPQPPSIEDENPGDEGPKVLYYDENGNPYYKTPGPTHEVFKIQETDIITNQNTSCPEYVVGRNNLWIFLNGAKSSRGQTFKEIGEAGKKSNLVKWLQPIPAGTEIEFVIW